MPWKPDYNYTEHQLYLMICWLARGKEDARSRLYETFLEHNRLVAEHFPDKMQKHWTKLMTKITRHGGYKDTIRRLHKSTCSEIISKIIVLYFEVKAYNKARQ